MAGSNGDAALVIPRPVTKQWLLPMATAASYGLGRARGYLSLWIASQGFYVAVVKTGICYFQMCYKAKLEWVCIGISVKESSDAKVCSFQKWY